ncbi:fungal-specific transcription factor domain-containing protein [Biscogniauxia sp. FL1348]|nr:fungal-specific transcription factor domain-containing protein [Biscogniauxia sp. FL1348]
MMDTDHVKEKRFPCSFPGCSKRFTRAEHMHRHALNHTPGDYTCLECRAHFKRPDLLRRHLNRHRQKDLEASGSSVLNTRKRSWKTIGGDIVETRPYAPQQQQQQQQSGRTQTRSDQETCTSEERRPPAISDSCELPFTTTDGSQQQQQQQQQHQNPWAADSTTFHDYAALEYDQIFQPDTASSFNMPYTTALDYNWLFNNLDNHFMRTGAVQETSALATGIYGQSVCDSGPFIATLTPPGSQDSVVDLWAQQQGEQTFEESNNSTLGSNPSGPASLSSPPPPSMTPLRGSVTRPGPETVTHRTNPQTRTTRSQDYITAATTAAEPRLTSFPERERPLSMLERSSRIPRIDEEVYERLINVIEVANPHIPGPPCPVREHPLLSLASLNTYLELYFTQFNTAYPLLHLPTFNLRTVEPLLLLSALLLGATYSSKDIHQLAVCVHDVIRPSIFAHAGFSARPELWTLQTILLVECFGKSRAGQTQHDMSHLFHGLLINLIRRSDCQSVRPEGPPPPKRGVDDQQQRDEEEEAWRRWAQAEQKKRLALICFMCDTQHAVLFCQSLCMSAFELRVTLPCSQSIWEAPDAASWASRWRAAAVVTGSGEIAPTRDNDDNSVPFLAALKSYLTHQVPRPARLTGLSRVLLLHGLMSVAWDMQRREQTALGVVDYGGRVAGTAVAGDGWRRIISNAYDTWKSDFDAHCAHGAVREDGNMGEEDLEMQCREMDAFAAAYNTVYHAAQALLYMDFLDVQIYAGARHILGRPVQQKDYLRSSQVVRRWAADLWSGRDDRDTCQEENDTAAAGTAAWHAARLLLDATDKRLVDSSEAMGLFHVPWCLFLATLTCWAVHHARPRQGGYSEGSTAEMDQDDIVWDPEADMRDLVVSMARTRRRDEFLALGKRSTVGLVWLMADELTKVRWGIIRSGVVVLRGLVPQRLINRYEEPI